MCGILSNMADNKDFFEQLAGVKYDDVELEPQFVSASTKKEDQEEDEESEVALKDGDDEELIFDDAEGHLTIDVYQDVDNIVIESTIAGVDSDDVDISITPESVSIKGTRQKKEKVKDGDYLYQECFWGKFSRSVILPQEIDPDRARASFKNGVLKIILPKIQRSKSKKIKVSLS